MKVLCFSTRFRTEYGDAVLDSCAAQAENNAYRGTIKGTGKVMSLDLHAHKVRLIKQQAERLGQKMSKLKR